MRTASPRRCPAEDGTVHFPRVGIFPVCDGDRIQGMLTDRDKRLTGIVSIGNIAVKRGQDRLSGEALKEVSQPAERTSIWEGGELPETYPIGL